MESPPPHLLWRRPRVWIIGIVLLALIVVIVHQSITFIGALRQVQDGRNQPVGMRRVRRSDIRLTIRALGAVTPLLTVTVTPQISG